MRVVKNGEVPFDLYGTCDRCKCEVEAEPSDSDVWPIKHSDAKYQCKCPTERCGETIYLWRRDGL